LGADRLIVLIDVENIQTVNPLVVHGQRIEDVTTGVVRILEFYCFLRGGWLESEFCWRMGADFEQAMINPEITK
jgi:hypothetical protein